MWNQLGWLTGVAPVSRLRNLYVRYELNRNNTRFMDYRDLTALKLSAIKPAKANTNHFISWLNPLTREED